MRRLLTSYTTWIVFVICNTLRDRPGHATLVTAPCAAARVPSENKLFRLCGAPAAQIEARAPVGRGKKRVRDRTICHGRAHQENVAVAGYTRPGRGQDDKEH